MRTLQEWRGYRDFKTTLIYADYAPSAHERAMVEAAFAPVEPDGRRDGTRELSRASRVRAGRSQVQILSPR